ncbi:hypothetical protein [Limosilactobacillus fermentum]
MTAAEATNKRNGTIIIVAGCRDGHGGDGYFITTLLTSPNCRFLQ